MCAGRTPMNAIEMTRETRDDARVKLETSSFWEVASKLFLNENIKPFSYGLNIPIREDNYKSYPFHMNCFIF